MTLRLYAGGYAPAGIRRFRLDPEMGLLPDPGPVPEDAPDASFLAAHPRGGFLYAVHELESYGGKPQGAVSAYAVDPATGGLAFLNRVGTGGSHPCHLALAPSGGLAWVANYTGGNVAAFAVGADGRLGEPVVSAPHALPVPDPSRADGRRPDPDRQSGPHAHCILPHPSGAFAVAADLGADGLFPYAEPSGRTAPTGPALAASGAPLRLPPGRGPRHLAFHPAGRIAYAVGELEPVLTVLEADKVTGMLRILRETSLLPPGPAVGRVYPSEVKVHPSGRLLVAALRGAGEGAFDGFAIFALDASGDPVLRGHFPSLGDFTRHFAFDPEGRFLVAAHQKGGSVSAFRVDAERAALSPLGKPVAHPAPACVVFA